MLDTGRGVLRATRAALVTLLVVGLAASAHALGGGAAPGLIASGVLALLVGPVAWWCTRRRMTSLRLVMLLGGAQAAVHVALATMAPVAGTATAAHVHGALPAGLAAGHFTAFRSVPAKLPGISLGVTLADKLQAKVIMADVDLELRERGR